MNRRNADKLSLSSTRARGRPRACSNAGPRRFMPAPWQPPKATVPAPRPLPYRGTCSEIYILYWYYKSRCSNAFEIFAHAPRERRSAEKIRNLLMATLWSPTRGWGEANSPPPLAPPRNSLPKPVFGTPPKPVFQPSPKPVCQSSPKPDSKALPKTRFLDL